MKSLYQILIAVALITALVGVCGCTTSTISAPTTNTQHSLTITVDPDRSIYQQKIGNIAAPTGRTYGMIYVNITNNLNTSYKVDPFNFTLPELGGQDRNLAITSGVTSYPILDKYITLQPHQSVEGYLVFSVFSGWAYTTLIYQQNNERIEVNTNIK